jgi:hypothetical protein
MTHLTQARRRAAALTAVLSLVACGAALSSQAQSATPTFTSAPAPLQPGFIAVGDYGAFRLDAVRDGTHEGQRVRFVDMTLHNRSADTTFPGTIQQIWWQGRNNGDKVDARFRDLKRFGMYDFIKPGQVIEVTYIMPVRADIDGIRADYMKAPKGQQERRWTWDELIAGGPGTLYHKGRPVGSSSMVATEATPDAPRAATDAAAEPEASANTAKRPTPVR